MALLNGKRVSAILVKMVLLLVVLAWPEATVADLQSTVDAVARKPLQIRGSGRAENLVTGELTEDPLNKPLGVAPGDTITVSFGRKTGTWTYVFTGDEPRPLEFSARLANGLAELLIHGPKGEELIGLKIYNSRLSQAQFEEICRTHPGIVSLQLPSSARELTDLTPVRHLTRLAALRFRHASQVPDLKPLATLKNLVFLDVEHCDSITTLEPLAELKNLTFLMIRTCDKLTTLEPLSGLSNLRVLKVHGGRKLQDIRALARLSNLEQLSLSCPYKKMVIPLTPVTTICCG